MPADFKFNNSQKGIKGETRELANALGTSTKYAETSLKILIEIGRRSSEATFVVNESLDELLTCQFAHLRYLQEEQGALFVHGSFGKRTHGLFRHFQKQTTAFRPEDLEALRTAATLASLPQEHSDNRHSQTHRGAFRPFRGGFHGGFRGRGRGQFTSAGQPFAARSVAPDRIEEQNNQ